MKKIVDKLIAGDLVLSTNKQNVILIISITPVGNLGYITAEIKSLANSNVREQMCFISDEVTVV